MKHPEGATTTAESRLVSDELKQIIREHLNICMSTIRSNRSHQDHQDYHHQNETDTTDVLYCPANFDGYACWHKTLAGSNAVAQCPDYVTGFDKNRFAYKTCLENGSWFVHPESGIEWANYTTCVDIVDFKFRGFVNELFLGGYTISLLTLIISLSIFLTFRSLKCTRIRIHIQLFTSLALSCVAWIVWYKFIEEDPSHIGESTVWCVSLHLLLQYLMLANYFWMFCEGLHLHLVLVVVFVKDAVAMRWFLVVGWISPIAFVSIYGIARSQNRNDSSHCWLYDSYYTWILLVPVLISLIASIVFLVNVVRVLLTKLHPNSAQPAPLALRKAARATLILVPLFGLQNVLLPFRPNLDSFYEKYYQVLSAILVSLQGFCVSCLFCFANHDVLFALRNLFSRYFPIIRPPSYGESNNAPAATQSRDVIV